MFPFMNKFNTLLLSLLMATPAYADTEIREGADIHFPESWEVVREDKDPGIIRVTFARKDRTDQKEHDYFNFEQIDRDIYVKEVKDFATYKTEMLKQRCTTVYEGEHKEIKDGAFTGIAFTDICKQKDKFTIQYHKFLQGTLHSYLLTYIQPLAENQDPETASTVWQEISNKFHICHSELQPEFCTKADES